MTKKVTIIIYIAIIVLILGLALSLFIKYKDNIADALDIDPGIEFTADKVKDKKFSRVDDGVQIYTCKNFSLWSSAFADVYEVAYEKDGVTSISSLPADDGTTFSHLIVLNGSTPVWNLTNRAEEGKTFDLYFTVTDGYGLTKADDLYYAKGGSVLATESAIGVFDDTGKAIKLSGDTGNKTCELGQPYKVTFTLGAGKSCVLKSSSNRLVIYGINCY